ncbi:DUF1127 domain-containing protein [Pseudomonas lopnurensis]|uniref:DUF1127 domain-containing protein n=1 Tax=Pseudomonas lopnurensis TaxID=1477517 RepID=UPI0018797ED2|nr:DUF1127 domain-containing protein [Pseudomonas lopnurensis]MBE7375318.1 DUF1127 domain-containing protein [Pseudomonas lopnurensis]
MDRALPRPLLLAQPGRLLQRLIQLLRQWRQNARTRCQLARLDDRQLADIGISHSEREAELSKPFWR